MTKKLKSFIETEKNITNLMFGGQITITPELSKQEISFLKGFIRYKSFTVNTKGQLVFGMGNEKKMFYDISSFPMSIHPNKISFDSQACGGLFYDETNMGQVLYDKCFNDLVHWINILTDFIFKPDSYFKIQFGDTLSFLKDHSLNGEILGFHNEITEVFHLELKDNHMYYQDCFINTHTEDHIGEMIDSDIITNFYWGEESELNQVYNELLGYYRDIVIEAQNNMLANNITNNKPNKKRNTL